MERDKTKLIHRDLLYFKEGDYLFREGDTPEGFFCIYNGSVKVFSGNNGKDNHLATEGDYIGPGSVANKRFINSAKTVEDSFCCFFTLAEVQKLVKNHRPFAEKIRAGY